MKKYIAEIEFNYYGINYSLWSEQKFRYDIENLDNTGHDVIIRQELWGGRHKKFEKDKFGDESIRGDFATFKHSYVDSFISYLKDKNLQFLNLKHENPVEAELSKILINIHEPIEVRIKVCYNKDGKRI